MSADIITNPGSQWSSRGSMVLPNLDFTTPTPGTTISKSPRSSTASTASTSSSFSSSSVGNRWSNETSLTEPDLAPQDSGKAAKNGTTVG
ncbi:hypothetical protein EX30DRAFT_343207, partial [Ascodesmis nigricans]